MTHTIRIADDFSPTPAGRFVTDGPFSGERFRDEFLVPALKAHDEVEVDLSGVFGFGSSFLEETFGGLVRKCLFKKTDLLKKMRIKSSLKTYENKVWQYIKEAKPEC
ncbi:STAS-like domain-containing protein [Simplicispira psychrophila]|uniref:STAS-like domain-containing protein n=1 Tax=Simplicispira psychrophila TaxID=80882 RepID=UPI0004890537|nr:STAS-like domain-containing protein [Simplicispira psychrophila]